MNGYLFGKKGGSGLNYPVLVPKCVSITGSIIKNHVSWPLSPLSHPPLCPLREAVCMQSCLTASLFEKYAGYVQGITRGSYVFAFHLKQIGGNCPVSIFATRNLPVLLLWGYAPFHASYPHLTVVINAWKHAIFPHLRAGVEPCCAYAPSFYRGFDGAQCPIPV